ncbi:MAG: ABC transporter permease [Planctomycetaceae bacterium]
MASLMEKEEFSGINKFLLSPIGLFVVRAGLVIAFLLAWQFSSGTILDRFWVSSPTDVAERIYMWFADGSIWRHLWATGTSVVLGYLIGSGTGIMIGLLLGPTQIARRVLAPYLTAFYSMPKIALAPLLVIALGIGIESKVALLSIVVVFNLIYSTIDGVRDIDADITMSLRLMGATQREIFFKLLVPATLPWIYSGLRIAVPHALTAAVMGELIAANQGVGFLIASSSGLFESAGVFAAVFILLVVSVTVGEIINRIENPAAPSAGSKQAKKEQ